MAHIFIQFSTFEGNIINLKKKLYDLNMQCSPQSSIIYIIRYYCDENSTRTKSYSIKI